MKYLCIYRVYDKNHKYKYFVENGKYEHSNIEYLFVDNDDYLTELDIQKYDRYVYLDSTVSGPFYPAYIKDKHWIHHYEQMRSTANVQMLGSHPVNDNSGIYITYPHIMTREAVRVLNFRESAPYRCLRLISNGMDIGTMTNDTLNSIIKDKSQIYEQNINKYEVLFTDTVSRPVTQTWDHISYILTNRDLYKYGIVAEDTALQHYNSIGRRQKRPISKPIENRYMTVCLADIGNTSHGLSDQLNSLVTAIIIGHYSRRAVVTDYLYTDTDGTVTVPLSAVFDIDLLNSELVRLGIDTRVIVAVTNSVYDIRLKSVPDSILKNYSTLYNSNDYLRYLYEIYHEDNEGINIGTVTTNIQTVYPAFKTMFFNIIEVLQPTVIMQNIVQKVKNNLSISQDYIAVHLRLEDASLMHSSLQNDNDYGVRMANLYNKLMSILKNAVPNNRLFMATGLGKSDNSYNFLLQNYPGIITKDYRDKLDIKYAEGTAMDALIDYLICKDSSLFIGTEYSLFSKYIERSNDTVLLENITFDSSNKYCILKYIHNNRVQSVVNSDIIHAEGPSTINVVVSEPISIKVLSEEEESIPADISNTTVILSRDKGHVLQPGLYNISISIYTKYTWQISV